MMSNQMQCKPNDFWYTPEHIFDAAQAFFDAAVFDPCPASPAFDGLHEPWGDNCYINPPYSTALKDMFIAKANMEFKPHKRFLWLLNYGNTEALWRIHNKATAVCIPEKRVRFIPGHPDLKESSPRYDNIFILWGNSEGFAEAFKSIGKVYSTRDSDNGGKI